MRAYRCDACHKMYLLPDTYEGDDCEPVTNIPPSQLQIYTRRGVFTYMDLCEDCLEKVMNVIGVIRREYWDNAEGDDNEP